jgi:NADH-quinone oxidoreductase subunit G
MKPVVSCATNARAVLQNSNVYHDSVLVKKARENILEFLLLNHPLDCPICDQGGDCDLQDQSLFFGFTKRRFYKFKRIVSDKDLGPIVKTVMTRCIHCTRCVRFASEIAGTEELGMFGRGNSSEIGTYIDKILETELSGNVIDLCPVGALTLKSFPFELRGWDIEKFESIDPTDGFGTATRVYISKQNIIQIEPCHGSKDSKPWLSDKGRQFFDSLLNKNKTITKDSWEQTVKNLIKTFYLFEHCAFITKKINFFTIVFENLELEKLSLLKILEKKYPFIKLRRAEKLNVNNDLESNIQLNTVLKHEKLQSSTLCLLIASNPRYEGYNLNLNLRQRYLKGNFECLQLGSSTSLTFPTKIIGTNVEILKEIAEGTNFTCQNFKASKNPLLIFTSEFNKLATGKRIIEMMSALKSIGISNSNWNGINTLNSSLSEVGQQTTAAFLPFKAKDFTESSSFYFLNTNTQTITNLKKVTELKLLNCNVTNQQKLPNIIKTYIDQTSSNESDNKNFLKLSSNEKYTIIPCKMFYENKSTYITTEGLIKRTNCLINKRKTKDGWKLLRNFLKQLDFKYKITNSKPVDQALYNPVIKNNFIYFTNLHYHPTEKLDSINLPVTEKNYPFFIFKQTKHYKQTSLKILCNKSKYWLDDFYTGGKDLYSRNSLILSNCSKILRTQHSNFF